MYSFQALTSRVPAKMSASRFSQAGNRKYRLSAKAKVSKKNKIIRNRMTASVLKQNPNTKRFKRTLILT